MARRQTKTAPLGTARYQFDGNTARKRMAGYALLEGDAPIAGNLWLDKRSLPEGAEPPEVITITVQAG